MQLALNDLRIAAGVGLHLLVDGLSGGLQDALCRGRTLGIGVQSVGHLFDLADQFSKTFCVHRHNYTGSLKHHVHCTVNCPVAVS